MITIRITMTGTSQLVMHNIRLSDPLDEFAKSLAAVSAKRKKTEADFEEMGKIEFAGGLYTDGGVVVVPTANIRACIVEGAKLHRGGRNVERALMPTEINVPLIYKGPKTTETLWADKTYVFRTAVKVGQARVQRTRPRFPEWGCESSWTLLDEMLDIGDLTRFIESAGLVVGLGDHRTLGSGRFNPKVTKT